MLVERAGGAACSAGDEFSYAEHNDPHTQQACTRAVKQFMERAERQGVELASVTPKMVGHGHDLEADLRAGLAAAERCRATVAAVAA